MKLRNAVAGLTIIATATLTACAPEWGSGTPTPPTTPGTSQSTSFVYAGPRGTCDQEKVLVGARVRPCQGLANPTAKVIVTSKVLDPICVDFYGYYPITSVIGTAKQGSSAPRPLTQVDTTPGTPAFDTGFNVDDGPITVNITDLRVNTAGGLVCGWFG